MIQEIVGFIGLGNMGKPMAGHILNAGFKVVTFDIAGTVERAPEGATIATSAGDVAQQSTVIFLSLPTLKANADVVAEIAESDVSEDFVVVNTSTVGPTEAVAAHNRLRGKDIAYVDAPVSGGAFGAREGTLAVMFSGEENLFTRLEPLFAAFGVNSFNVGAEPGQGQRMKMVNNQVAISAVVTTSEAIAYGERGGLDMKMMLDVLNVSSGRNYSTEHLFPRFVLPGTHNSGGPTSIIRKDIALFIKEAKAEGCRYDLAESTLDVLKPFDDENPDSDQTEVYPFIRDD